MDPSDQLLEASDQDGDLNIFRTGDQASDVCNRALLNKRCIEKVAKENIFFILTLMKRFGFFTRVSSDKLDRLIPTKKKQRPGKVQTIKSQIPLKIKPVTVRRIIY